VSVARSAFSPFVTERFDDHFGRRTGGEPLNFRNVDPAAPRDFIARARLRAFRHIAEKDVMMLLPSAMLEQKFSRLARKTRFLLELAQCGIRQILAPFEHAAGQRPFGATSRNQQNPVALSTDDRGSLPQAGSEYVILFV